MKTCSGKCNFFLNPVRYLEGEVIALVAILELHYHCWGSTASPYKTILKPRAHWLISAPVLCNGSQIVQVKSTFGQIAQTVGGWNVQKIADWFQSAHLIWPIHTHTHTACFCPNKLCRIIRSGDCDDSYNLNHLQLKSSTNRTLLWPDHDHKTFGNNSQTQTSRAMHRQEGYWWGELCCLKVTTLIFGCFSDVGLYITSLTGWNSHRQQDSSLTVY